VDAIVERRDGSWVGIDCADPTALARFWGAVLEVRWALRDESWAVALGARVIRDPELGPTGDGYVVLADPEGNEFCFVVDESGEWMSATREALIGVGWG